MAGAPDIRVSGMLRLCRNLKNLDQVRPRGRRVTNPLGTFPQGPSPTPLGDTKEKHEGGREVHEQVSGDLTALPPYGSGGDRGDKWGAPLPPPR